LLVTLGISAFPRLSYADQGSTDTAALESLEPGQQMQNTPARTVRINLKTVPDAEYYEVMVTPSNKIWSVPLRLTVNSDTPVARLRLSPGDYTIRTRSLDQWKNEGPWSNPSKFSVSFRPLREVQPSDGAEVEALGQGDQQSLVFEWPRTEQAKFYFFRLRDESGKTLRSAVVEKTWIRSEIKANAKYSWIVVPLVNKQQSKAVSEDPGLGPYFSFNVVEPSDEAKGTTIKISSDPQAKKYEVEVVGVSKDEHTSAPSIVETPDPEYKFKLPPGEYEMRARSVHDDASTTAWSAPSRFFIRHAPPQVEGPSSNTQIEDTGDPTNKVTLRWKKQPNAGTYQVGVFNDKDELVLTKKTKDNFLEVELPPDMKYKWGVRAYSNREIASEMMASEATSTFSIDKYIPLALTSAEEPSQFYGWAKQVTSQADYIGANWDTNTNVQEKLLGGETEAAVGYWWRKTKFGLLAQTSVEGFNYQGSNYFYGNYGVNVGYRSLLDNGDRLRFWVGAQDRETPEVLASEAGITFSKLKSLGPQLQVAYLHSFSETTGIQVTAAGYYSLVNQGTPNGEAQNPTLSYRASVMGTYMWSRDLRLAAGYAYQLEQASYGSTDRGRTNTSSISGNYLSLMAEFALEKSKK
jgi:hypothetical protein